MEVRWRLRDKVVMGTIGEIVELLGWYGGLVVRDGCLDTVSGLDVCVFRCMCL